VYFQALNSTQPLAIVLLRPYYPQLSEDKLMLSPWLSYAEVKASVVQSFTVLECPQLPGGDNNKATT